MACLRAEIGSISTLARTRNVPRPVSYASLKVPSSMMIPPVGKSGPGNKLTNSSTVGFGRRLWRMCFTTATTSLMLCGGILVAMPTAIPLAPFMSKFGNIAGRHPGSSRSPSKFGWKSTVSSSMSCTIAIAASVRRASVYL